MAKKAKKKPMHRGRRQIPQTVEPAAPPNYPPPGREVTIDSVMRDLSTIKSTLSSLL